MQDDNNNLEILNYRDVIHLARQDKISNAKIIDKDYLLIEGGLSSLGNTLKSADISLELTDRLIKDNKVVGYKAKDKSGKPYTLTIDKVWKLAYQQAVKGVKAKIINDTKVILSTSECKLDELNKIKC